MQEAGTQSNPNESYWKSRAGHDYAQQQRQRAEQGNRSYEEQERWLFGYLSRRAQEAGRRLRVLDFGCGFGRLARLLSDEPFIEYYGYDFSPSMVAPLVADPPASLVPIEERVRVAESLNEAFENQKFDVIFTVSVLIHNPPEKVSHTLQLFLDHLATGGEICLVENRLCSFSCRDNNWHGGCWIHDYASYVRGAEITVLHKTLAEHDIYLLRRTLTVEEPVYLSVEGAPPTVSTRDQLRLLGLERIKQAMTHLEHSSSLHASIEGELRDAQERCTALAHELAEWRKISSALSCTLGIPDTEGPDVIVRKVEALRTRLSLLSATSSPIYAPLPMVSTPPMKAVWNRGVSQKKNPDARPFQWEHQQDTEFAHSDPRFEGVCHVFHQEWVGIRAAAGSLPGKKLAISAVKNLARRDIREICELLADGGITRIIYHGVSHQSYALLDHLARQGFVQQYIVWHGTPAQWSFKNERDLAFLALSAARKGIVKKFHAIRRGYSRLCGPTYFHPQLLNAPPRVTSYRSSLRRESPTIRVLVPSWNLFHKNVHANVVGAALHDRVDETWVTSKDIEIPNWVSGKVRYIGKPTARAMLDIMAEADAVANVTLVDCHPMVELEALAVGTPALRGPLFLDSLEDHPYSRLTTVENPLSIDRIYEGLGRVLDTPPTELIDMMTDYRSLLTATSLARYADFVDL